MKIFITRSVYICSIILLLATAALPQIYENVLRVRDGEVISFDDMSDELLDIDVIFIGESHSTKSHHEAQLDVIKNLSERGIPLSIGLEMFMAQQQPELDLWIEGELSESSFRNIYRGFWNLPWQLYGDIFLYARKVGIPMIGLNVPHAVTRKISTNGLQSLSIEESEMLPPDIICEDIDITYKNFIARALRGHDMEDEAFTYFCEAQMVWDKTMAWNLLDYMDVTPGRSIIVLAGSGHSWKRGIPEYVRTFSDYSFAVILPETAGIIYDGNITLEDADYLMLER